MKTDPPRITAEKDMQTTRPRVWRRRIGWSLALVGAALIGLYERQPYEFDLLPRTPPRDNPWIDPDSKGLFRAGARIAIVTAHPDDTEFYIAGLLTQLGQADAHLDLIVATDGDKGYYPFVDANANRRIRRVEQTEAAQRWRGREVVFLGYPDGRLPRSEELVKRIAEALTRMQPDYILAFDSDYPPRLSHHDHRTAGWAAERAVRQAGVGRWLLRFSTIAPNYAVNVTDRWNERLALLRVHKSQFHGSRLRRVESMITRSALADGRRIGVHYAEGFRCSRLR